MKTILKIAFVLLITIFSTHSIDVQAQGSSVSSKGSGKSKINGHEYVDLGLPSRLKWATCNVGAKSPSDYGSYFAWGEINTKSNYTKSNCLTFDRTFEDISGDSGFDAARANWGGSWRLPTKAELEELLEKCEWSFITMGKHKGYKVTGPNGKSIFLPAAGNYVGSSLEDAGSFGFCWSSTPFDSENSYILSFSDFYPFLGNYGSRYRGRSVRPVSE